MTNREKNNLVKQYEPLVNKITAQFFKRTLIDWYTLKSMAYEGLALAIKRYDPNRSDMNFTQYAAFAIRNNILTCLDNELRAVKVTDYWKKKLGDNFESFNSISIDKAMDINMKYNGNFSKGRTKDVLNNMVEDEKSIYVDCYKRLYEILEGHFRKKHCIWFYMYYGLNGYEETKGIDIAKQFNVTAITVSANTKKIIHFIQEHEELKELIKK